MKRLLLACSAILLMCHVHAEGQGKHLFILSGQSNMARFNPAVSFTPAVVTAFGEEHVIVVKDAQGGQPIRRWYKDWKSATGEAPEKTGDLYDQLMTKVKKAIDGQNVATVTFIWMQGERDAKENHHTVYGDSLKGLVAQLSQDLGRDDINVIIGRLSDNKGADNVPWTSIRQTQVELAEANPRWEWVNTDDLNDGIERKGRIINNDLHYSAEGYKLLGLRYAEKAIALIQGHAKTE